MKFVFIILLFVVPAYAIDLEVIDGNGVSVFRTMTDIQVPRTLGDISVEILSKNQIIFQGGNSGFSSINGLANDVEVISDTEMKAYGWCFSVDGIIPETMANQTMITNQDTKIRWYYSYAHFKDGNWFAQCEDNQ